MYRDVPNFPVAVELGTVKDDKTERVISKLLGDRLQYVITDDYDQILGMRKAFSSQTVLCRSLSLMLMQINAGAEGICRRVALGVNINDDVFDVVDMDVRPSVDGERGDRKVISLNHEVNRGASGARSNAESLGPDLGVNVNVPFPGKEIQKTKKYICLILCLFNVLK